MRHWDLGELAATVTTPDGHTIRGSCDIVGVQRGLSEVAMYDFLINLNLDDIRDVTRADIAELTIYRGADQADRVVRKTFSPPLEIVQPDASLHLTTALGVDNGAPASVSHLWPVLSTTSTVGSVIADIRRRFGGVAVSMDSLLAYFRALTRDPELEWPADGS